MGKRFISPDWKKLRVLPGYLQRAWFYIWDQADAAGVYHFDEDYIKLDLGLEENIILEDLAKLPACEILSGERILIKNFLVVNYVQLKPNYNPHKPAFRAIEENKLKLNASLNEAFSKLEEEDKEEDKEEEGGAGEEILPPQPETPAGFHIHLDIDLPAMTLEAIQRNQYTMTKNENTDFVLSQWQVFLSERMADPPERRRLYRRIEDLTSYFTNWMRNKFPKNERSKDANRNSKNTGAYQLLDSFRQDLTASGT